MAESAERRREIDVDRAKAALDRAEKRLASEDREGIDFMRARAALARAIMRIKLAESPRV